jgi:hypothetical protein
MAWFARNATIAALSAALAGCATIPEDKCATTDWHELGVADGRAGHAAERLVKHREACAGVKIEPDEMRYLQGRKTGLSEYCRIDRAIDAGLAGNTYEGVCDAEFARLHAAAYAVWRAKRNVDDNVSAVSWREAEIRGDKASDSRKAELRSQVRELDRKRETLRHEQLQAELELNRVRTERALRLSAAPVPPAAAPAPQPRAASPAPAKAATAAAVFGTANGKATIGKTAIALRFAYLFVAPDPLEGLVVRPMLVLTQERIPDAVIEGAKDLDAVLAALPHYVVASRDGAKQPKVTLVFWHPQLGSSPVIVRDAAKEALARFDIHGDQRLTGRLASPGNGSQGYAGAKQLRLDVRFDAPLSRRFR